MPCFSHTRNAYSCLNGSYRLQLDLLVPDLAEQKDSASLMEKIPGNYKELPGAELPPNLHSLLFTPCSAAPFRAAEDIFNFYVFRKTPET